MKGKAGATVAHKASSHKGKGKGPLGGCTITRKILVTQKGKGKSLTSGQKSLAGQGQGVGMKQLLPSRKRSLESSSAGSLPWKKAPVAVTNSTTQNPVACEAHKDSPPAVTTMEVEVGKDDPSGYSPLPRKSGNSDGEEWVSEVKHPPAGTTLVADAAVSAANSSTEHLRSVGIPDGLKTAPSARHQDGGSITEPEKWTRYIAKYGSSALVQSILGAFKGSGKVPLLIQIYFSEHAQ